MKYILFTPILVLLSLTGAGLSAQNTAGTLDDAGRLAIYAYVPDQVESLHAAAKNNLKNKLAQIVSNNGLGSAEEGSRFIISASIDVLTKDITSTAPSMHVYTLQVNMGIGDGIEGIKYASHSITVRGVGKNEAKAYISALKNISTRDQAYQDFVQKAQQKILEYYNTQCDFIIKEAETYKNQREFDKAIHKLMSVPQISKECYDRCMDKSMKIFKEKLEFECQQNIARAKTAIAKDQWEEAAGYLSLYTPDLDCYKEVSAIIKQITDHQCAIYMGKANGAWAKRDAELAGSYLSNIPTDSECIQKANQLAGKIKRSLDAAAQKRWELAYEKYNRNQNLKENRAAHDMQIEQRNQSVKEDNAVHSRDMDHRNMDYKENQGFQLEGARIQAMRDVGVAYGENQPRTVNYNVNGWW